MDEKDFTTNSSISKINARLLTRLRHSTVEMFDKIGSSLRKQKADVPAAGTSGYYPAIETHKFVHKKRYISKERDSLGELNESNSSSTSSSLNVKRSKYKLDQLRSFSPNAITTSLLGTDNIQRFNNLAAAVHRTTKCVSELHDISPRSHTNEEETSKSDDERTSRPRTSLYEFFKGRKSADFIKSIKISKDLSRFELMKNTDKLLKIPKSTAELPETIKVSHLVAENEPFNRRASTLEVVENRPQPIKVLVMQSISNVSDVSSKSPLKSPSAPSSPTAFNSPSKSSPKSPSKSMSSPKSSPKSPSKSMSSPKSSPKSPSKSMSSPKSSPKSPSKSMSSPKSPLGSPPTTKSPLKLSSESHRLLSPELPVKSPKSPTESTKLKQKESKNKNKNFTPTHLLSTSKSLVKHDVKENELKAKTTPTSSPVKPTESSRTTRSKIEHFKTRTLKPVKEHNQEESDNTPPDKNERSLPKSSLNQSPKQEFDRKQRKKMPSEVKFAKFSNVPSEKSPQSLEKFPNKKFDFKTIPENKEAESTKPASANSSLSGPSVSFSYPSSTSVEVESVISLSEFRSRTRSQNIPMESELTKTSFKVEEGKVCKSIQVGYHPVYLVCPKCHNFIITKVTRRVGCTVYFVACALCLIFPLCGIIPFLTTAVFDAHHWCPFCGAHIGVFKP